MNPLRGLEERIVGEVTLKRQELLGNGELQVASTHPLYHQIGEYIDEVAKDWPKVPGIESIIVKVQCTACALLTFDIEANAVFLDAVTGKASFGPLNHKTFGVITTEDLDVKVQNIRLAQQEPASTTTGPKMAHLNSKQVIRLTDVTGNSRVRAIADVSFNNVLQKDYPIEFEQIPNTGTLKVRVASYKLSGKIQPDGQVTFSEKIAPDGSHSELKYGSSLQIHDIIGPKKVRWVNFLCAINVPFIP